ncbi:MAG: hypothetical protein ABH816_02490 [Candidatus Levyibacteriota bacterium]
MKIRSPKIILIIIILLLTIMPFFWLKPGEMDLGGDGGRLYFYDPVNQIKNLALYNRCAFGIGTIDSPFSYLPFIGILAIIKTIVTSSYILICFHNALKLAVGFLAVYAIVKQFIGGFNKNNSLGVELASMIAGLFYLSTPAMTENYVKAIATHDQVFLNPLMFYLLLRFALSGKMKYMWIALIVGLVFSVSFSYMGAPSFFAFYPLAFIFILFYGTFIRHVKFPWRKLLLTFVWFFGLHAFHLIPEASDLFTFGSNSNTRMFNIESITSQIGYFYAILHIPKTSFYLFSYSLTRFLGQVAFVVPLIVVLGLIFNKKKEKTMLLVFVFFLVTFFFVTGKVTVVGIKIYEWFFHVPGFSMFRNFYGQWQFVYYFFYSLLFGLAFYSVISRIKSRIFLKCLFLFLVIFFTISSWQFINGSLVNPFREDANGVKAAIIMDPNYENTLKFIRSMPDDGKILVLPFSDSYMQVIHGLNNGVYVGHSTIGQLTGKNDFAGYQGIFPYSDTFWQLSKEKNYKAIKKMFGILNIHYIFYNSDTRIYDTAFPGRPYSPNYVRKFMPPDQAGYKEYIGNLSSEKIFESGFYSVYKLEDKSSLPHFYTAQNILFYKDDPKLTGYGKTLAFFKGNIPERPVYIESQNCKKLFKQEFCREDSNFPMTDSPKIQFEKINPTKYKLTVSNANNPYILVFSEAFHSNWKIYAGVAKEKNTFFGKDIFETFSLNSISNDRHFIANGYANGWYIKPQDLGGKQEYELIIEMTGQRIFYVSLIFSGIIFIIFVLRGIIFFDIIKKRKK